MAMDSGSRPESIAAKRIRGMPGHPLGVCPGQLNKEVEVGIWVQS